MECRKLSVLMPVFNEARTLRAIIRAVLDAPVGIPIELICVDDGSKDGSLEILRSLAESEPRIRVFEHGVNRGKGAAIRTAIGHMTGDIAVIQDADLEYDPREYPALLRPILEGKADAVFGSRFASSPQRRVLLFWHSVANRLVTLLANVLNDINLTDVETCYKAVRADVLRAIPLRSERFGIEPELTTRLAQWNLRIYEVPVSYHGRTVAEGKKIGWKDAVAAVWCLFKFRFFDTKFTTHDGFYILQSMRRARGFNRWMLSRFERFIGTRVYEAGCGIGNFTELLLDRERLVCVDNDPFYAEMIQRRFGHLDNIRTMQADLSRSDGADELRSANLDTVICLNVLEHIEADRDVLRHFHDVLAPGGHAIILVPAHPKLYSECDRVLGHVRRYTRAELEAKVREAGFEIVEMLPFNRLGTLGWWVNGKLGRGDLTPMQMKTFELLLPLAKLCEALRIGPALSLIAVGRKPLAQPARQDAATPVAPMVHTRAHVPAPRGGFMPPAGTVEQTG